MSDADRQKWDARYAAGSHSELSQPCGVLRQHLYRARRGRALDVACGAGRNALHLARSGFKVDAVDISSVGMDIGRQAAQAEQLSIQWHCVDLLDDPQLPGADYDLILMCHFVAEKLLARLPQLLAPGGVLMVEQHLQWQPPPAGGLTGPQSQRFRVAPGSQAALLLQAEPQLQVLVEEEGLVQQEEGAPDEQKQAALARLVVAKPEL